MSPSPAAINSAAASQIAWAWSTASSRALAAEAVAGRTASASSGLSWSSP